ncbi:MAG: hypothetical protein ACOC5E_00550 [Acidobacteriota bacterium]
MNRTPSHRMPGRVRGAALAAVALALTVPAVAFPAVPQDAPELGLEEVLANHYEVMGGLEDLGSVDSMRVSGSMTLGQGMQGGFTNIIVRPNKMRLELEIQGMTGVQAYDGETAWMFMPFMGQSEPEAMPDEMAASVIRQADIDGPLVNWQDKGHRVDLVGMADVEGTETYELEVVFESGHVQRHYLDAEYFVPVKVVSEESMGGSEFESVQMPSDYKEVEGILVPHSIRVQGPQGTQTLTVESVEIGVEVDESIFEMPETEEADEGEQEGGSFR